MTCPAASSIIMNLFYVMGRKHIAFQSLNSYRVVKIFFQEDVNISSTPAQVPPASQTVLKLLPAPHHADHTC
jgi:hypothetical protein